VSGEARRQRKTAQKPSSTSNENEKPKEKAAAEKFFSSLLEHPFFFCQQNQ
jgi:hypothetical protein